MKSNALIIVLVQLSLALLLPKTASGQNTYTTVVSNDLPVLYWNFNEESGNAKQLMPIVLPTTLNDLSPSNAATRISHSSQSFGLKLGNAASFLVGDFFFGSGLAVPTNSLAAAWALEFWVQVQGETEFLRNDYLMGFGPGGNYPGILWDYIGAATPRYGLELFSAGRRTGAGPLITDLNWHHVVYAFYGDGVAGVANRLDIYFDGVLAAESIRGEFSAPISLTQVTIGTSTPQFAGPDGFEGNIDEVAVYSLGSATTEAQVTAKVTQIASHFGLAKTSDNYTQAVLADGPFLYWNFNESSGAALQLAPVASAPVNNDLVPSTEATRLAHAGQSGLGLGSAASFPTAGGRFSIGALQSPFPTLNGPWAMEVWMQAAGDTSGALLNDYLVNLGNSAPAILFDYIGGANPNGGVELYGSGTRSGVGPSVEDHAWHHLFFAYYGDGVNGVADRLDIYLDGTNAFTNIRGNFAAALPLGSSLVVGTSSAQWAVADGFEGNLDELAIYNLNGLTTETAVETKVRDMAARHYAAAQGEPVLAISRTGNQLVISWKAAVGYDLVSSSSVTGTWNTVGTTPVIENGIATVTVDITGQSQFYRLRKQN